MNVLGRRPTPVPKSRVRPVVIDCIASLDRGFVDTFRSTIAGVGLERPVLVEFKRATVDDMDGLIAMAGMIGERRNAGGYAAFLAPSSRWRQILERSGIPHDYVVSSDDTTERRRIILAEASRPRRFVTA